jgi:hypothetical protein
MFKKLLCTSALVCFSLAAGSLPGSKQFTVSFSQAVQVGTVKLAPGDYKVKVVGDNAIFTDSKKKEFTAPVKIEKIAKKAPTTAVETKEINGVQKVDIIDVGGADFKLVF